MKVPHGAMLYDEVRIRATVCRLRVLSGIHDGETLAEQQKERTLASSSAQYWQGLDKEDN